MTDHETVQRAFLLLNDRLDSDDEGQAAIDAVVAYLGQAEAQRDRLRAAAATMIAEHDGLPGANPSEMTWDALRAAIGKATGG